MERKHNDDTDNIIIERRRENAKRFYNKIREARKEYNEDKNADNLKERKLAFFEQILNTTKYSKMYICQTSNLTYPLMQRWFILDDAKLADLKQACKAMQYDLALEFTSGNEAEDAKMTEFISKLIQLNKLNGDDMSSRKKTQAKILELSETRGNLASLTDWILYKNMNLSQICTRSNISYAVMLDNLMQDNIKVSRAHVLANTLGLKVRWRIRKIDEPDSPGITF